MGGEDKMTIYIGIDPGLTGGLAVISDTRTFGTPIPTITINVKKGKGWVKRKRYDLLALHRFFYRYTLGITSGEDMLYHVILEEQFPMPMQRKTKEGKIAKQASVSMFSTGLGYGIFQGLLTGLGMKYTTVHPKTWQKEFGIGTKHNEIGGVILNTKEQALLVCEELFPDVNLMASERSTVPHKGIVDALLIAMYGKRQIEEKE